MLANDETPVSNKMGGVSTTGVPASIASYIACGASSFSKNLPPPILFRRCIWSSIDMACSECQGPLDVGVARAPREKKQ